MTQETTQPDFSGVIDKALNLIVRAKALELEGEPHLTYANMCTLLKIDALLIIKEIHKIELTK